MVPVSQSSISNLCVATLLAAMLSGCGGGGGEPPLDDTRFLRGLDPGPGIDEVIALEQNWSDYKAVTFYNAPQGSRLVPYDWFINLEQADNESLFNDPDHMRSLGYLTRDPGNGNPDALPIGFVRDAPYDDGTAGLGITCSACHTAQINFTLDGQTTAYLIDGAPAMGDLTTLLNSLEAALEATLLGPDKFERFADRVIPGASQAELDELWQQLSDIAAIRSRYNALNIPDPASPGFGHGRADAFGAIMNQVSVEFLGNAANATVSNAPVNYPHLWDTPHMDVVQWNGSALNYELPEAERFIGTAELGALLRNAAQVMGVFGAVEPGASLNQFGGYRATVNYDSMIAIEKQLRLLWSPQWPAAFGEIDPADADAGAEIFLRECQDCHRNVGFRRTDRNRSIRAQMHDVGTDPLMDRNFDTRLAATGVIAGRYEYLDTLFTGELLNAQEPISTVMVHVAIRSLAGPDQLGNVFRGSVPSGLEFDAEFVDGVGEPGVYAYKARPLNGIWATAPYLHNGSVPNLWELLKDPVAANPDERRAEQFYVGDIEYDPIRVGFVSDRGPYLMETTNVGNTNSGHVYGTELSDTEKWQLIEYLKTL